MHVTIDQSLDADADLRALVTARSPQLEGVFNGTATAEWRKGTNWEGKPAVQLRLRDGTGARVGADLLPAELANPTGLETRFYHLRNALETVREWRAVVAGLFATIRPWCERLPGKPRVSEHTLQVAEGESGEYEVTELSVARGDRTLRIGPVAAWVIGWEGLVGMYGPSDRAMLYYSRDRGAWFHIPNYLPYRELPLTEPLFGELAEACLDD
jgi:hypothetical protein